MFTVYTASRENTAQSFLRELSPITGTAIRFRFGTEEQPYAIAGHIKRADKQIYRTENGYSHSLSLLVR